MSGRLLEHDVTTSENLYLAMLAFDGERWMLPMHGMPKQRWAKPRKFLGFTEALGAVVKTMSGTVNALVPRY
jgi:hypothetical protein